MEQNDDNVHNRHALRAPWIDYNDGIYFVTVCTADKEHFLGEIYAGDMHMSRIGVCLDTSVRTLSDHYPYARVMRYIVMPNHFHALIALDGRKAPAGAKMSLSHVVGSMKAAVTRFARKNQLRFDWQERFYEHRVRDEREYEEMTNYIVCNVLNWINGKHNGTRKWYVKTYGKR